MTTVDIRGFTKITIKSNNSLLKLFLKQTKPKAVMINTKVNINNNNLLSNHLLFKTVTVVICGFTKITVKKLQFFTEIDLKAN